MEKVLEILSKSTYHRSPEETKDLFSFFSNFDFFSELQTQDDSGSLFKTCINSLQIKNFTKRSDLSSGIYVILTGSAKYFNPKPSKLPKFIKIHQSNQSFSLKQEDFSEIFFEPGSIFGQMGKTETYPVTFNEPSYLAVLLTETFEKVSAKAEEELAEKFEMLKNLDLFKNWSRKAVKNAAKAFERVETRKGAWVYKENECPESVYLVAEGEFKLTQGFVVPIETPEKNHEFGSLGSLRYPQLRKNVKKTNLQLILKQKGEIFGHNEFISKTEKREFSASCNSNHGVLYVISEKEFFKKFAHPETMKIFEEQNKIFQMWTSRRLVNLKTTESYKVGITHSPKKNEGQGRRYKTPAPETTRMVVLEKNKPILPRIIDRVIGRSAGKAEQSFAIFSTELSMDFSRKRKFR
jgi:CRP-like cAMP-binding protein